MKVKTRNTERTVREMYDVWWWMTKTFGPPMVHNDALKRWTYGKDSRGFTGSEIVVGTHDIEWIYFFDEKDAIMFMLRWG